jgi:hypothetical protein
LTPCARAQAGYEQPLTAGFDGVSAAAKICKEKIKENWEYRVDSAPCYGHKRGS